MVVHLLLLKCSLLPMGPCRDCSVYNVSLIGFHTPSNVNNLIKVDLKRRDHSSLCGVHMTSVVFIAMY